MPRSCSRSPRSSPRSTCRAGPSSTPRSRWHRTPTCWRWRESWPRSHGSRPAGEAGTGQPPSASSPAPQSDSRSSRASRARSPPRPSGPRGGPTSRPLPRPWTWPARRRRTGSCPSTRPARGTGRGAAAWSWSTIRWTPWSGWPGPTGSAGGGRTGRTACRPWRRCSPGSGRPGWAPRSSRRPPAPGSASRSSPSARRRATRAARSPRRDPGTRVSRREAWLSAGLVFIVALLVRAWAAAQMPFPIPEDATYYWGVARNLAEGRGLVSDALWSYVTPARDSATGAFGLFFPRPAFEIWLPLPSLLALITMTLLGSTAYPATLAVPVLLGAVIPVFAWRIGADLAAERVLPPERARTLALGTGLVAAVSLPLVLSSAVLDSTAPFGVAALAACLLGTRLLREPRGARARDPRLIGLGLTLGLAALARNEAIWVAGPGAPRLAEEARPQE